MRTLAAALSVVLFVLAVLCTGCTAPEHQSAAAYSVTEDGVLHLILPTPVYDEDVITGEAGIVLSSIVFQNEGTGVHALLASPEHPSAAIVYVPGAGVPIEAHRERAMKYSGHGIASCVLDVRGNGDATPGYPLDLQRDFEYFRSGEWPQYYLIIADVVTAGSVLAERFDVPVYATGSSNGGRYAAIATAMDAVFAGYIGVSTSGFGIEEDDYSGDARRFLLSVDPATYIAGISPRPALIFHAPGDRIIPYDHGVAFYEHAENPREFISFNGTQGVNAEVDDRVIRTLLTFNVR
jgi:fermentation-respiration switch protein FrsA (DUF1100 family)